MRILFLEIPCVSKSCGVNGTSNIIHFSKQKKYKEEAERTMSHYNAVLDTPEMQRVRENQRNFSTVRLCFYCLVSVFCYFLCSQLFGPGLGHFAPDSCLLSVRFHRCSSGMVTPNQLTQSDQVICDLM